MTPEYGIYFLLGPAMDSKKAAAKLEAKRVRAHVSEREDRLSISIVSGTESRARQRAAGLFKIMEVKA